MPTLTVLSAAWARSKPARAPTRAAADTEMSKERRDNMRLTSRTGCFTHANVVPFWVFEQALSNASAQPLTVGLEETRDEAAQRGNLAGAEVDGTAQRHCDDAESGHFLRGVRAFRGAGAEALHDGAAELLHENPADKIDG